VTDGQIQHEKQGAHCVWDANQQWRQASVMSGETALALGLMTEPTAKRFAIVATHDCDCVTGEDEEPQLELIIGREIEKEEFDGNLALAKSTRRLHLEIEQHGKYIELSSITKGSIDKTALMGMVPSQDVSLNTDQRRVFRRWLAARYERVSFPDELVRRLRPVIDHFKKVSKNNGANVIGIYIQFEPDQELERDSVEPYSFKIFVVYDSSMTDAPRALKPSSSQSSNFWIRFLGITGTISSWRFVR
jgi:hypothetical protein